MKPKIIFMPHANLQYSQLQPEKRKWVIETSYEKLFDLIHRKQTPIAFEASGYTIEAIAKLKPEVLEKLKALIKDGLIEPVSSPYIHIMLANIPPEIGLDSLKHARFTWERYVGVMPEIGWNPECGWAYFIPQIYKEAGFKCLVMDADSLFLSFEEIRNATGLKYDVKSHSNKNHLFKIEEYIKDKPEFLKYVTNPSTAPNGLKLIFRSDCMANPMLWFLMGATEGVRNQPVSLEEIKGILERWKERIEKTGSFILPYAEDAEYIGTSAYFYVKQFNQARFFEPEPGSVKRFEQLIDLAMELGYELSTPSKVIEDSQNIFENPHIEEIENGIAWHGGTSKAWSNTIYSLLMDPVCLSIFNGIKAIANYLGKDLKNLDSNLNLAMKSVTAAWVSDSRWPPAPTSPGRFNVKEAISELYAANKYLKEAMIENNIEKLRSLYSPELMETQIKAIEEQLMEMKYFGEK